MSATGDEDQLTEYANRLKEFIKYKRLNVTSFSGKIGVSERNVANSIAGMKSQIPILFAIGNAYPDLNMGWLLNGRGEMMLNIPETTGGNKTLNDPVAEYKEQKEAEIAKCKSDLEKATMQVKFLTNEVAGLKQTVKDKDEIIALLKSRG